MKTEYEITTVPVGEELTGTTTDFLGRQAEGQQLGISDELPLFNEQAPMDDREQIQEPLFTGLKVGFSATLILVTHVAMSRVAQ